MPNPIGCLERPGFDIGDQEHRNYSCKIGPGDFLRNAGATVRKGGSNRRTHWTPRATLSMMCLGNCELFRLRCPELHNPVERRHHQGSELEWGMALAPLGRMRH